VSGGIIEATGFELEPTPWAARAACAGSNSDVFFPNRGEPAGPAKTICAGCAVQPECLDYALRWNVECGVWGGLTKRERDRLTRPTVPRRIPAAHGTTTRYARGCHCEGCRQANYEYQLFWRPGTKDRGPR
jgi:WhiB family redox-sensing transcriptional regulator